MKKPVVIVWKVNRGKTLDKKFWLNAVAIAARHLSIFAGIVLMTAQPAFAGAAAQTFGPGGPGLAIVQLVLMAAFGSLCYIVAGALGQGQIANMIKLVTVFTCIAIVIGVVWKAIAAIATAFGVTL